MISSAILSLLLVISPFAASGTLRGSNIPLYHRQLSGKQWKQVGQSIFGANYDFLGNTVAMNEAGDIFALGAPSGDGEVGANSGYVQVYKQLEGKWVQVGSNIDGVAKSDQYGYKVSLNAAGNIVAMSARFKDSDNNGDKDSGRAQVFKYDDTSKDWIRMGTEDDIRLNPSDGTYTDAWLETIALSGDGFTVIIGVSRYPIGSNLGEAHVYQYNATSNLWVKKGQLLHGRRVGVRFGSSLDISSDGSTVAVGSYAQDCSSTDTNNNCGSVRVFAYLNATGKWTQIGSDIMGQGYKSEFGRELSLSGDGTTLAVGATQHGLYKGQTQVFKYNASPLPGKWAQVGSDIDGEAVSDQSGSAVSINKNGTVVAIGAWGNNGITGTDSGHIRVYRYSADAKEWIKLGSDLDGEGPGQLFGWSVAISGDGSRLVAGAPDQTGLDFSQMGSVRVFDFAVTTNMPSYTPTAKPSKPPSSSPTKLASVAPSAKATSSPSSIPSATPSQVPLEDYWTNVLDFFTMVSERATKLIIDTGDAIDDWVQ